MLSIEYEMPGDAVWGILVPEEGDDCVAAQVEMPVQTHSANVAVLTRPGEVFADTDAIITSLPNVAVGVRTADCVPVVVYAPDIRAVAAIHAGWKGSVAGIAGKTIDRLSLLGADPAKIKAGIGPCICAGCYEVSEELAATFRDAGFGSCVVPASDATKKPHLDLTEANILSLVARGVSRSNISSCGLCTLHSSVGTAGTRLPSWRRVNGEKRRIITFIKLKP